MHLIGKIFHQEILTHTQGHKQNFTTAFIITIFIFLKEKQNLIQKNIIAHI